MKGAKKNVDKWSPVALIATVGGSGYSPFAPGTAGSAAACLLYVLLPIGGVAILVAAIVGTWAAELHSRKLNAKDPGEIVVDELVGMWLTLYGLPLMFVLPGFFLFRVIDILKPGPIAKMEKLPGGIGIMADDVLGGILGNLVLQVVYGVFWGGGWLRTLLVQLVAVYIMDPGKGGM